MLTFTWTAFLPGPGPLLKLAACAALMLMTEYSNIQFTINNKPSTRRNKSQAEPDSNKTVGWRYRRGDTARCGLWTLQSSPATSRLKIVWSVGYFRPFPSSSHGDEVVAAACPVPGIV